LEQEATWNQPPTDACQGMDAQSCFARGEQLLNSSANADRVQGYQQVLQACALGSADACDQAATPAHAMGETERATWASQRAATLRPAGSPPPTPPPEPLPAPPLPQPEAQPQPQPEAQPQPQPEAPPQQVPQPPQPQATGRHLWVGPTLAGFFAMTSDGTNVGFSGFGGRMGLRVGARNGDGNPQEMTLVPAGGVTFGIEQLFTGLGLSLSGRLELVSLARPTSMFPAFNAYAFLGVVGLTGGGGFSSTGFRVGVGLGWNLFALQGDDRNASRACGTMPWIGCSGSSGSDLLLAALLAVIAVPQLEAYYEVLDIGGQRFDGFRFSIGIGF